jgi:hypothetical protein
VSIHWISYAWKAGPSSSYARYVYLALADNANEEGLAFPSIRTIVAKTRLSESTVRRNIANLEAGGWLEIERGKGKGNRSRYKLKRVSDRDLLANAKGVAETNKSCQGDGEKVAERQAKGVTVTNPPHPLIGVTVIEPSVNCQGNRGAREARLIPSRSRALAPVNTDSGAEMQAAVWLFEELGAPSDTGTLNLAAQAIKFQAREWGGMQQAAERILALAKEAKEQGEMRWRFWFQDSGYLAKSTPANKAAQRNRKWEEFMESEDGDATGRTESAV